MKEYKLLLRMFAGSTMLLLMAACNNTKEKQLPAVSKKEIEKPAPQSKETNRPPIINITDTVAEKKIVLTIKDSAATLKGMERKLEEIYGVKLPAMISKNNLKVTGAAMAWYQSQKAPYFFEAGIPIEKKPAKLPKGIYIKQTGTDSVIIAHFYGPYNLTSHAYEVVGEMMKERKKKLRGTPYEIYVDKLTDSTGRIKDPYKVQTDIIFPWRN